MYVRIEDPAVRQDAVVADLNPAGTAKPRAVQEDVVPDMEFRFPRMGEQRDSVRSAVGDHTFANNDFARPAGQELSDYPEALPDPDAGREQPTTDAPALSSQERNQYLSGFPKAFESLTQFSK